MGILSWIVVGLIAGWLAGSVMRGRGFGIVGNIIIGILGALIGGFLAQALFKIPDAVNGFNLLSVLIAAVGAIILIAILRLFRGNPAV
jgi:uncharacterized membrane protein YeaQ/YmgE (transglycosylase-associated protein family)